MTTSYFLGPTNSDITGQSGDFSKQLDDTAVGASTLTWSKPGNGTEQIWGVAQVGVPGNQGITGTYTVKFNIIQGLDAGSTVRVAVRRINSAGVAQATSPFTATQLATAGPKTFELLTITLLTWAAGDRLVVIYEWAGGGTMSSPVSIQFEVGTTAAEVVAPWTIIPPVTGTLGVTQDAQTLAAAGTAAGPSFTGTLAATQAAQTLAAAGTVGGEPQLVRPVSDRLVGAWTASATMGSVRFDAETDALKRTGGIGLAGDTIPYTYCGWVNRRVDRNDFTAMLSISPGTTTDGDQITTPADGDVATAMDIVGGGAITGPTLTIGEWFFVAVTVTGTTRTFYWRADAAGSLSSGSNTIAAGRADGLTELWVGDCPWTGQWFNGSVTSVKLWSTALNGTELLAESFDRDPVRTANLQGAWPLAGAADLADVSGNGRHLVAGGTAAADDTDAPSFALFAAVDETVATFADHIRSEDNPANSPVVLRLAAFTEPAGAVADGDVQVRVQYDKEGADTATLVMQLRQGYVSEGTPGTLIASITDSNVTDATEDGVISLTAVEHSAIVYTGGVASNLDVRLVADLA